jgi:hypothetical protein
MIVVISQSASHQPQLRDHEESLVTHLLLEAKCEVNLVPDLAHLESDSTGLLCLEGIRGSMFLLSWHERDQALDYLEQHGIRGRLVQHGGDQDANSGPAAASSEPGIYDPMQRTIHHLTLDLTASMDDYQKRIEAAGRDSKVRTVSLGGGTFSQPPNPGADTAGPGPTPVTPVPKRSEQYSAESEDDLDLDALLDELDNTAL